MTVLVYAPGIDLSTNSLGFAFAFTVQFNGAGTSVTITVTDFGLGDASKYVAHTPSGLQIANAGAPWGSYQSFADAMTEALENSATDDDFGDFAWDVTFDPTTCYYTIENTDVGAEAFTVSFGASAAGISTRKLIGYATNTATAVSHIGTRVPSHLAKPQIDERSMDSDLYEPRGITSHAIASDGTCGAGISRATVVKQRDWVQQYEPDAVVHAANIATGTGYWTWESWFPLVRQNKPFAVVSSTSAGGVYMMREKTANFDPKPQGVDSHENWHIAFDTYYLGDLAE